MEFEVFLEQLKKSESKCKLARTTWFTPEQRQQLKHQFITLPFKRGDRKYTLVIRR